MPNLLAAIPATLPQELLETLATGKNFRIERIVSKGHTSPADNWYDQDQNEWVLLVSGAARLQFENEVVNLHVGDWIDISAHRKHRVDWTHPTQVTIWLAVFYEPTK